MRQEDTELKFWSKALPTLPSQHTHAQQSLTFLRPWDSARTSLQVLDSPLLLQTIPGHTWVPVAQLTGGAFLRDSHHLSKSLSATRKFECFHSLGKLGFAGQGGLIDPILQAK